MRRDAVEVHKLIQSEPQNHHQTRTDLIRRAVCEFFNIIVQCHAPLGHAVHKSGEQGAVALVTFDGLKSRTECERNIFFLLRRIPKDGKRRFANIHSKLN